VGFSSLGFLVLVSYGLARPSVETVFNARYGAGGLPLVWIAVAFTAVITVIIYNRFAARIGLLRLFLWASSISLLFLIALVLLHRAGAPGADFALYVWKDVYIVVLVEIFWTYANAHFSAKAARWIYGFFLLVGSAGSIVGLNLAQFLASNYGNERILLLLIPCIALIWGLCTVLRFWLGDLDRAELGGANESDNKFFSGLKIIKTNRYLFLLVALIAVVQVVINLVDYEFNAFMNEAYLSPDARSAATSQIYKWVEYGSLALQVLTGVFLSVLGIGGTLLLVPIVLGIAVAAFGAVPIFSTMAIAKVSSKCMDYSIFRAAKEILYIPLSYREKTQGKAVVDILCYRVAKVGASLLLIVLGAMAATGWIVWCILGLILVWIWLTLKLVRMYEQRAIPPQESEESSAP
jgi:AAA family ATP:ADP antiporter